jgi:ribosomal protein S18 acetylase RimI-like enzyme
MEIRAATAEDRAEIWEILAPLIGAGETYALPRDMDEEAALAYWLAPAQEVFVATIDGSIAGTYYLRANQQGGGAHIANCGYVTSQRFARRGIAAAMCEHSLAQARACGFKSMQFNFVVASNEHAVRLWRRLGFRVVGTLPAAFDHPRLGFVDALVMFQEL